MPYLTKDAFAARSDMPSEYLDALEARSPGWIDTQILQQGAWLDARLAKRYVTPFAAPYPEILLLWLTTLVTMRCWIRHGVDASDVDMEFVREDYERTLKEVEEAANSETGLFQLPPRQSTPEASGIARGAPLGYSEQSPYAWHDVQAAAAREDDRRGGGS